MAILRADQVKFVLAACSKDDYRPTLQRTSVVEIPRPLPRSALCGKYVGDNDATCPQLTCVRYRYHDGACDNVQGDKTPKVPTGVDRWLCGTDGHRLHAVRVDIKTPLGGTIIGRGCELAPYDDGTQFPPIAQVWEGERKLKRINALELEVASSAMHKKAVLGIRDHELSDDDASMTVKLKVENVGQVDPAAAYVLARFVREALYANAEPRRGRLNMRVDWLWISQTGPLEPITLQDSEDMPSWRAIIMPRRE